MSVEDRRSPVDGARFPAPGTLRAWGYTGPGRAAGHVHAGVDLGGAPGTPVLAPEASIVAEVGTLPMRPPWTGYAPAVLLRGASGRFHLLAHLSGAADGGPATAPVVLVGDRLVLGQTIGYIGRERHTHWEVRTRPHARRAIGEDTLAITIDPGSWLDAREVQVPRVPRLVLDPSRARLQRFLTGEVLPELG